MKKLLNNIREFFWPLLDEITDENPSAMKAHVLNISDENLETAFAQQTKIHESEDNRLKTVESKAALLLSTISVASSIVVTASAFISGTQEITWGARLSLIVSALIAIYGARTVWYSVKALERGTYQVVNFEDINIAGSKTEYFRHLIRDLMQKTKNNQDVINKKVDFVTLAQEYYKRAVMLIFLYAFVVLGFSLFSSTSAKKEIPSVKVSGEITICPKDTINRTSSILNCTKK